MKIWNYLYTFVWDNWSNFSRKFRGGIYSKQINVVIIIKSLPITALKKCAYLLNNYYLFSYIKVLRYISTLIHFFLYRIYLFLYLSFLSKRFRQSEWFNCCPIIPLTIYICNPSLNMIFVARKNHVNQTSCYASLM